MSKILICVDCQYDFMEGGNLPVNGGKRAMQFLSRYVARHAHQYDVIICTLDWHPAGHCSFTEQGGQWPKHCVQHSHGAALFQPLYDVLPINKLHIFEKGVSIDKDEYSFLNNAQNLKRFSRLLKTYEPEQIDVCGIAGDVCVMNTITDLLMLDDALNVAVITPAVASLDDSVTNAFIEHNSLKVIKR